MCTIRIPTASPRATSAATARPPLPVAGDDKPLGDWTIATRYDGTKQWLYKGRPVYLRFHDSPEKPTGDGLDGSWQYLQP